MESHIVNTEESHIINTDLNLVKGILKQGSYIGSLNHFMINKISKVLFEIKHEEKEINLKLKGQQFNENSLESTGIFTRNGRMILDIQNRLYYDQETILNKSREKTVKHMKLVELGENEIIFKGYGSSHDSNDYHNKINKVITKLDDKSFIIRTYFDGEIAYQGMYILVTSSEKKPTKSNKKKKRKN